MEPILLSLLTFPQKYEDGILYFNILLIPRNINPLTPLKAGLPAFVDANFQFETHIINTLDGPPIRTNVTNTYSPEILTNSSDLREVWMALKDQIEKSEQVKVDDGETANPNGKFEAEAEKYKNVSIKKYLPETYRKAFNFTKARTKYAVLDDEYECAVKNKKPQLVDTSTDRNLISWGKLVAFCLRNPKLAEKAGLIYRCSIPISEDEFNEGGWMFTEFAPSADFAQVGLLKYAARIPALKEIRENEDAENRKRNLFAAVVFPISENPGVFAGFDRIMAEAIQYDDGFAKIVHSRQPINQDFLQETDKSNPPQMDFGVQLGWDDEQLSIWYNRQMLRKEEISDEFVDTPLGVFAYAIDVRESEEGQWKSQNSVVANGDILLNGQVPLMQRNEALEMGTEVHPISHGNSVEDGFWLPMYYTNWIGKSLAIPDKDGQEINNPEFAQTRVFNSTENAQKLLPKPTFYPYSQEESEALELRYGIDYQFRVRLMDLTGGAASTSDEPLNGGQSNVSEIHFKRHIAAAAMQILNVEKTFNSQSFTNDGIPIQEINTSILENLVDESNPVLRFKRPLLSYPAVVFTGKYNDPITDLKNILRNNNSPNQDSKQIGLFDPDVDYIKVKVEVKTLEMDNVNSENGKEPYVKLYEKEFQLLSSTNDYSQTFDLNIVYQDDKQLNFVTGFDNQGADNELILPTARNLRITISPIISQADNDYADDSVREGKSIVLTSFKASQVERNLLSPIKGGFKAFYLQPTNEFTAINVNKPTTVSQSYLVVKQAKDSIELTKIAEELNLETRGMTLLVPEGHRVHFGCSKEIRHSLAPDSSSLMISENSELFNQWISAVDFSIQRDWAWDALKLESISIYRSHKNEKDNEYGEEYLAGTVRIFDTANMQFIKGDVQRDHTRFVFLDAIDPKLINKKFPDEIYVKYRIQANFREEFEGIPKDKDFEATLHLPITSIPQQVPKLVSAGMALSPYTYDTEKYSYSNSRQRFLWLEFEEPPINPDDTYYVRVLNNAPDPLLCRISEELIGFENQDKPFHLDAEKMRIIVPGMDNDYGGFGLMQELIPENTPNGRPGTIYMVPLPVGMHANSDELFGFFTYEIRVGHKKEFWSTAQARYGRPLKVNSVQHPAPELICNAYRNTKETSEYQIVKGQNVIKKIKRKELVITAPFANAVLNGKNVAAFPPQTSLWYLLYTQVLQADGKSYRNLLIDSGNIPYKVRKNKISSQFNSSFEKEDGTRYGVAYIPIKEIQEKLVKLNLSKSNPISVLTVEMFPMDNEWQFISKRREDLPTNVQDEYFVEEFHRRELVNPLTEHLGSYRIYRSSPLVSVEDICCEDC